MSNVNIASSAADAEAADKVEQHHAEMAGRLALLTRSADRLQARFTSIIPEIRVWVDAEDAAPAATFPETGNPALAHLWYGIPVKRSRGEYVPTVRGENLQRRNSPELVRKAATRIVEQ